MIGVLPVIFGIKEEVGTDDGDAHSDGEEDEEHWKEIQMKRIQNRKLL